MSLPSANEIRSCIEQVPEETYRICLKAHYLCCTRIIELVSIANPRDNYGKVTPRGPKGTDVRLDSFNDHPLAIFKIKMAKRQGKERLVALPTEEEYEPWTQELYTFFQQAGSAPVFPFTKQKIWRYIKDNKVFKDLTYPIDHYTVWKNGELRKVADHTRFFGLHALRHLRATELVEFYGFDGFNLATYGGWTIKGMVGISSTFDRYVSLNWQSYFPKLLKRRIQ